MGSSTLHVEYKDCYAGWIEIVISGDELTIHVRASEVYDPFPDLVGWLEAIVQGVPMNEFIVDEEGNEVAFRYIQEACDDTFILTDPFDGRLLLQMSILPKMLVTEFYTELLAFAASPAYHKEEWEIETLGERVNSRLGGIPEDELIDQLLVYPARAIQQIFWQVAPSHEFVYPNTINPQESMKRFCDYVTDDQHPLGGAIKVPDFYPLPQGFDELPFNERYRYLKESLTDRVSSYSGVKLGELRSCLIEEWLMEGASND